MSDLQRVYVLNCNFLAAFLEGVCDGGEQLNYCMVLLFWEGVDFLLACLKVHSHFQTKKILFQAVQFKILKCI